MSKTIVAGIVLCTLIIAGAITISIANAFRAAADIASVNGHTVVAVAAIQAQAIAATPQALRGEPAVYQVAPAPAEAEEPDALDLFVLFAAIFLIFAIMAILLATHYFQAQPSYNPGPPHRMLGPNGIYAAAAERRQLPMRLRK